MKVIGLTNYGDTEYEIFYNKDFEFFEKDLRTNEIIKIPREDLAFCLTNPWDKVRYYEQDGKHHWYSIVYDFIEIDIWGDTIEDMLNNVALIVAP